ncbi:PIN domain-containing protein [Nocardioides lentus]|uniref:PIN domain-containing protein n=1 Tax=Nocardioides lentus TaxID=338077 RepID=A0ABN2P1A3_9ACTN
MIVLDTDVVAELLRGPRADPAVVRWVRTLEESPVTTVVNRAELLAGVALLGDDERTRTLAAAVTDLLADLSVCLPFTTEAASCYGELVATAVAAGRRLPTRVAMVACVARVHDAGVATHDPSAYDGLGLRVLDPRHV